MDRTDRAGHCYKVEIKKHFRMGNAVEGQTQQLKVKIGSAGANLLNTLVKNVFIKSLTEDFDNSMTISILSQPLLFLQ